jgi:hypothetical protein
MLLNNTVDPADLVVELGGPLLDMMSMVKTLVRVPLADAACVRDVVEQHRATGEVE